MSPKLPQVSNERTRLRLEFLCAMPSAEYNLHLRSQHLASITAIIGATEDSVGQTGPGPSGLVGCLAVPVPSSNLKKLDTHRLRAEHGGGSRYTSHHCFMRAICPGENWFALDSRVQTRWHVSDPTNRNQAG